MEGQQEREKEKKEQSVAILIPSLRTRARVSVYTYVARRDLITTDRRAHSDARVIGTCPCDDAPAHVATINSPTILTTRANQERIRVLLFAT